MNSTIVTRALVTLRPIKERDWATKGMETGTETVKQFLPQGIPVCPYLMQAHL